jgi:hypothetical protein
MLTRRAETGGNVQRKYKDSHSKPEEVNPRYPLGRMVGGPVSFNRKIQKPFQGIEIPL